MNKKYAKVQSTGRSLIMSILSLMLCFAMLIGTTYAWFTDSVTSGKNIIKSGNLDIEMYYADGTKAVPAADSSDWKDASDATIFNYELWEPGYTDVKHIKIANVGTLALKYQLAIVADGDLGILADVLDVYVTDTATQIAGRSDLSSMAKIGTLSQVLANASLDLSGNLMPAGTEGKTSENTLTIAVKMQEDAGNEYKKLSVANGFTVVVKAMQYTFEKDSFGDDYDYIEVATDNPGIETLFEAMTKKYEEGTETPIPAEIVVQTPIELKPVNVQKTGDVEPENYAAEIDGATTTINLMDTMTAVGGNPCDCWSAMRIQGQSGRESNVTFKGTENGKFTNVGSGPQSLIYMEGESIVNFESGIFETTSRIIDANLMSNPVSSQQINVSGGTFIFAGKDKDHQAMFTSNFVYGPFNGTITITGGTFYNCDPTGKQAAGYKVVSQEVGNDMIYTVVEDN